MEENFKTEIISPEKIIFSDNVNMTTLPSYEGDMSILKNHISIITFLKPGIIKIIQSNKNIVKFFIKDGTVEFFNDVLVILSSSAINLKDISKDFIENLNKEAKDKLAKKDITDHDRYILNHQLDVLKEISI
jgi:F-type H+-transporting ATPase subunit epsilon